MQKSFLPQFLSITQQGGTEPGVFGWPCPAQSDCRQAICWQQSGLFLPVKQQTSIHWIQPEGQAICCSAWHTRHTYCSRAIKNYLLLCVCEGVCLSSTFGIMRRKVPGLYRHPNLENDLQAIEAYYRKPWQYLVSPQSHKPTHTTALSESLSRACVWIIQFVS